MILPPLILFADHNTRRAGCMQYRHLTESQRAMVGKASIIPLSVGAPMPDDEHLTVKGGENEALIAATDLIKGLPGNAGFAAKIDFDPS